jgi:spermidine/putrescine-binding protein
MSKGDRSAMGKAGLLPEEINKKIKDRLEKDLHAEVARYLNLLSIPFVYSRTDKKSYLVPQGWADLTLCYRGKFVNIELKTGSNLSTEQQQVRETIIRNQGKYLVARTLEEVKDFFRAIDAEIDPKPVIK